MVTATAIETVSRIQAIISYFAGISVYVSSGEPDTDYCPGGHHQADWRPNDEQIEEYIEFLESLEPGDGIVICGDGPAPLMGRVKSVEQGALITEPIESPQRMVRWSEDTHSIEWANLEDEHRMFDQVYHVESVEVKAHA